MTPRHLEDFSPEDQRDIRVAFRLTHRLTRRLIIYPVVAVTVLGAFAAAKWEILMGAARDFSPLAEAAVTLGPVPLITILTIAAIPAYLISKKSGGSHAAI